MVHTIKRALLTGGAGFIGSHLARALIDNGTAVVAFDNLVSGVEANLPKRCVFERGDIRDVSHLRSMLEGVDAVFHLAAIPSVKVCQDTVFEANSVNMGGTMAVIEAVRDAAPGAPIIFASSAAVYGVPSHVPVSESAETAPLGYYGLDKLHGEHALAIAAKHYHLKTVALRLFNVYGERQDPSSAYSGVISIFADRISRNEDVTIFGDGDQTRDFVRAEDVAAHFVAAAKFASRINEGIFARYNVCTGEQTSINEVHALISAFYRSGKEPRHGPGNPAEILQSVGDRTRAYSLLEAPIPMPFVDGLPRYLGSLSDVVRKRGRDFPIHGGYTL